MFGKLRYFLAGRPGYKEAITYLQDADKGYVEEKLQNIYLTQGKTAAEELGELIKIGTEHVDTTIQRYAVDSLYKASVYFPESNFDTFALAMSVACKGFDSTQHKYLIDQVWEHSEPLAYANCVYKVGKHINPRDHSVVLSKLTEFIDKHSNKMEYQYVVTYLDSVTELMRKIDNPKLNTYILDKCLEHGDAFPNLPKAQRYLDGFKDWLPRKSKIETEADLEKLVRKYKLVTILKTGTKFIGKIINHREDNGDLLDT
jgi:hypothetical protein